ncbi:hypothetical protein BH10CYA1_BH10CYA1_04310 [soil metagenome]
MDNKAQILDDHKSDTTESRASSSSAIDQYRIGNPDQSSNSAKLWQGLNEKLQAQGVLPQIAILDLGAPENAQAQAHQESSQRESNSSEHLPRRNELPQEHASEQRGLSEQDTQHLQLISEKYDVKFERTVDERGQTKFNFYYKGADDKRIDIGSAESIEKGEKMLEAQVQERISRIEHDYHVHVSRDGEHREYDGDSRELRTPGIRELAAAEDALRKVQPGQFTKSQREQLEKGQPVETGQPLNLDFVKQPIVLKNYSQPISFFVADDKNPGFLMQNASGPYNDSVYTFIHEMSHNEQHQLGAFGNTADYAKQLGMHIGETSSPGKGPDWILEGKDQGEYYKRDWSPENEAKNVWLKTDSKGNPVTGVDGKPIVISNDDVQHRARLTPPTLYFPNPFEDGAEAITKFRQNEQTRAQFMQDSPALYQTMKDLDQAQLVKFYGKNADGTARFVRLPDGTVTENNESNRAIISQWESATSTSITRRVNTSEPTRGAQNCPCCSSLSACVKT